MSYFPLAMTIVYKQTIFLMYEHLKFSTAHGNAWLVCEAHAFLACVVIAGPDSTCHKNVERSYFSKETHRVMSNRCLYQLIDQENYS